MLNDVSGSAVCVRLRRHKALSSLKGDTALWPILSQAMRRHRGVNHFIYLYFEYNWVLIIVLQCIFVCVLLWLYFALQRACLCCLDNTLIMQEMAVYLNPVAPSLLLSNWFHSGYTAGGKSSVIIVCLIYIFPSVASRAVQHCRGRSPERTTLILTYIIIKNSNNNFLIHRAPVRVLKDAYIRMHQGSPLCLHRQIT